MTPNYKEYSLHELEDALAHIDREQFPERSQIIIDEIQSRTEYKEQQAFPSKPEFKEELHQNLIVRYWKGQLSLPMSYWGIGVLVVLISYGGAQLVQSWIESATSPVQLGIYVLVLYVSIITLVIWQSVGVYRSAGFHPLRGGSEGWAVTARVMVFIGLVSFSHQMYSIGLPIMSSALQAATGTEKYPATNFRILNEGADLELFGGLEIGSETLLEEQLQQYPDVKRIHLHSVGGRILAAKRMMKTITKYRLDTYVRTECSSSCTLLFLAGENKLLGDGAKLKFHSPSAGWASGHEVQEIADEMEDLYIDKGISKSFVNKVINTPNSTFWAPTNDELVRAKVVDRIVNSNNYAYSGLGLESEITAEGVESGLLTHDYMVAMKEHDPQAYQTALAINLQGMIEGLPLSHITNQFIELLYNDRVPVYLANASNAAIVEYWKAQIVHMEELRKDYPLACASLTYPDEVPVEKRYGNEGGITESTKALESKAIAHLIRTHFREQENIDLNRTKELVQEALAKVKSESEEYVKVVASAQDFVEQPELMCAASIALNEAFISFDENTSGQLLRSLHL